MNTFRDFKSMYVLEPDLKLFHCFMKLSEKKQLMKF